MPDIPLLRLNDQKHFIPTVGLGLWRVDETAAVSVVHAGIAAGYRLFDTAAFYRNEEGVGRAVAEAPVGRDELFIATKLWNDSHGYDNTLSAFDAGLKRLGLEYVDLYLIHWPVAGSDKYVESWRAMIRLRDEGRARAIGVSNFLPVHIERLLDATGVVPAVNQIEYHPFFQQPETAAYNASRGIATQCWAPLGRGASFSHPRIVALAEKYGRSPAQIVLRWQVEHGFCVIPKSVNPVRMRENIAVFDFSLDVDEVRAVDALHAGRRIGGDPRVFTGLS